MEFTIPGCRPDPPKRVSSKQIHLTYAALHPNEMTFDSALAAAKGWGTTRHGLREYCIGHELHSQPADPRRAHHLHLYLNFGTKVQLSDRLHSTVFDLTGQNGRILHPEIQSVKSTPGDRERVINYDMKDGDYVSELVTPLVNDVRRDRSASDDEASDSENDMSKDNVPAWARMLNKANDLRREAGANGPQGPGVTG